MSTFFLLFMAALVGVVANGDWKLGVRPLNRVDQR